MTSAVAYVGLGSNLGDPVQEVRSAVVELGRAPGIRVERCSSLYRTAPIGDTAQPDFINAVCRVQTTLGPRAVLDVLLGIEVDRGRRRDAVGGGPRILDLDLLLYGDEVMDSPGLVLPHPRLHERAFVLYPLAEIAPSLNVPGHGAVQALSRRCAAQRIERVVDDAGPARA
jgi:2-amino-4-hydroxy-6-hydroxymethyldihydropteridine diphosphokinase